jgi:hypothetical protein
MAKSKPKPRRKANDRSSTSSKDIAARDLFRAIQRLIGPGSELDETWRALTEGELPGTASFVDAGSLDAEMQLAFDFNLFFEYPEAEMLWDVTGMYPDRALFGPAETRDERALQEYSIRLARPKKLEAFFAEVLTESRRVLELPRPQADKPKPSQPNSRARRQEIKSIEALLEIEFHKREAVRALLFACFARRFKDDPTVSSDDKLFHAYLAGRTHERLLARKAHGATVRTANNHKDAVASCPKNLKAKADAEAKKEKCRELLAEVSDRVNHEAKKQGRRRATNDEIYERLGVEAGKQLGVPAIGKGTVRIYFNPRKSARA